MQNVEFLFNGLVFVDAILNTFHFTFIILQNN